MKKWQKVALFSASALLITALAACGSSKSSSSENGPTTIKMYQSVINQTTWTNCWKMLTRSWKRKLMLN